MRSGSVALFHSLTTGTEPVETIHSATFNPSDSVQERILHRENDFPIVVGSRRVQAPHDMSNIVSVCAPETEPSENENDLMASLAEEEEVSNDERIPGASCTHISNGCTVVSPDTREHETETVRSGPHFCGDEKVAASSESGCDDSILLLSKASFRPLEYGGETGQIDAVFGDKMSIDRLFLPIRENGIFKEGVRKKGGAKHVFLHPRDMLSHAYLHTSPDGVLHVLPGWDHESFIHDISYRYRSVHTFIGPVPFLGGDVCKIRKYRCVGVLVCPASQPKFRNSHHCEVDPENRDILGNLQDLDGNQIARKKVIAIFRALKEREECKKGVICGVAIPDAHNPRNVVACKGQAILVPRRSVSATASGTGSQAINPQIQSHNQRRCDFFIGCSGYVENREGLKVRHYARTIDIDNEYVPFLRRLMSGEEEIPNSPGDCNFVRDKNKGKRTCPRHGLPLLEVSCKLKRDDKKGNHEMTTFEPVDQEQFSIESKILYVSCKGEHLHPPPPPPEATVRKLQIIQDVQNETGMICNGRLRKEVQRRYLQAKEGKGSDGMSRFDGNLALTSSSITKVLRRIHPPLSKLATEVGELAILAADMEMPFVRDSKMVDGGYVFFLGLDEMILHASAAISFAGDATYRTVSEANRAVKRDGRWYLYNIVVHASHERANGAGVVVMRAIMTGLSAGFYYAVWRYFFDSIARAKNLRNGEKDLDLACVRVPYIDINPAIKNRSCLVASVTMDFDVAEIRGCAQALQALTGGTDVVHMKTAFIGCEVHLKRDLLRRASDEKIQKMARMSRMKLYGEYVAFAYARTRGDAEIQLKKIKSFDPSWVQWIESNFMGPLISTSLSDMSATYRTIGFSNTNVVESHNRRGNHLVGTRMRPGEAARGLYELDKVDARGLGSPAYDRIKDVGAVRRRSGSILRPVTANKAGAKKRSRTGGPVQQRNKVKKVSSSGHQQSRKSTMDSGDDQKTRAGQKGSGLAYEEISFRLQKGIAKLTKHLRAEGGSTVTPEQRVARLDTLVDILSGVHEANSIDKIDKVKQALLDALHSNHDDLSFREGLLELCISCFGFASPRRASIPAQESGDGNSAQETTEGEAESSRPAPNATSSRENISATPYSEHQ